jgi:hypothetical protein
MAASPRQSRSNTETEHDGDSIGTDGPFQRYTHTAGRGPYRFHYRTAYGTFASPSGLGTSAAASTRRISMRLRAEDRSGDSVCPTQPAACLMAKPAARNRQPTGSQLKPSPAAQLRCVVGEMVRWTAVS